MGARFLLIDGYNLLHAAGLALTNYRPGELHRRREQLLRQVAHHLTPAELARGTVIFDARDPTVDRPHIARSAGLRIIFARPEGDADVVITRWLEAHPAPRHVTLVSSDRELQRAARRTGARFVGSGDFLRELAGRDEARARRETDDAKPADGLSDVEVEYWTRQFGEIPTESLAKDLAAPFPDQESAAGVEPPPSGPGKTGATTPPPPPGRPNTGDAGGVQRSAGRRRSRRQPSRRGEGAKPAGSQELEYWLREFGDLPELRGETGRPGMTVADLEAWLREFDSP